MTLEEEAKQPPPPHLELMLDCGTPVAPVMTVSGLIMRRGGYVMMQSDMCIRLVTSKDGGSCVGMME